jgi:hypothetical protein
MGFAVAGLLGVVVFLGVYRRPSVEQLAVGLAAITLVAFVSLTTMHERYAYPAFVFLLLAMPRPVIAITWVAFAVVFAANLVVAVPPAGQVIAEARPVGIMGAVAMTVITMATIASVLVAPDRDARTGASGLPGPA